MLYDMPILQWLDLSSLAATQATAKDGHVPYKNPAMIPGDLHRSTAEAQLTLQSQVTANSRASFLQYFGPIAGIFLGIFSLGGEEQR